VIFGVGTDIGNPFTQFFGRYTDELKHLAWLDLQSEPGQEYWVAMELMGRYAAANHALIHQHVDGKG